MGTLIAILTWAPFNGMLAGIFIRALLLMLVFMDRYMNRKFWLWWVILVLIFPIWGFIAYMAFNTDTLKSSAGRMRRKKVERSLTSTVEILRTQPHQHKDISKPPFEDPLAHGAYVDHYIEELIDAGEIEKARKNVEKVLEVAVEMGDEVTVQKYASYRIRLVDDPVETGGFGKLQEDLFKSSDPSDEDS